MATKDKDKEKVEPVDTSTPDPLNAPFTGWVERLFEGGERVNFLRATQALGRNAKDLGQVVKTQPIKAEPKKPDIVRIANEFWLEFREEAEALGQPRRFLVEALNDLKGGSFAGKIVKVDPVRTGLVKLGR